MTDRPPEDDPTPLRWWVVAQIGAAVVTASAWCLAGTPSTRVGEAPSPEPASRALRPSRPVAPERPPEAAPPSPPPEPPLERVARLAEALGGQPVRCEAPGVAPVSGSVRFTTGAEDFPRSVPASVQPPGWVFPAPPEAGSGILDGGDLRFRVTWDAAGRCTAGPPTRTRPVSGTVLGGEGHAVWVVGCGDEAGATPFTLRADAADCELVAFGTGPDGPRRSAPLRLGPGDVAGVSLALTEAEDPEVLAELYRGACDQTAGEMALLEATLGPGDVAAREAIASQRRDILADPACARPGEPRDGP